MHELMFKRMHSNTVLHEKEKIDPVSFSDGTANAECALSLQSNHIPNHDSYPRSPTTAEVQDLPHVMANIPLAAWLLVFIGSAAACARYGVATPFQNYIQNPPGNPNLPGALNLGEEKATIITDVFTVFLYLASLPAGILSDTWFGRFRTMNISLALLLLGCIVLVISALPISLRHNAGLGGLIAAMVLIGLGQGGLSAVMYAFIADQIPEQEPIVIQKDGKEVIVDRQITLQFVFTAYFGGINFGSLSLIGSTLLEKSSYWSAYLLPTGILVLSIIPLCLWKSKLVRPHPVHQDHPFALINRVLWIACRSGFRLSAADPDLQSAGNFSWTTSHIQELRRGLRMCQVMVLFVLFFLCYSQISNNIISQAGQMELGGISNDTIQFLNVLGVVVFTPIIQSLSGLLRRHGIPFGPMRRITVAFISSAAALAYAAGVQQLIYSRGPCYSYPLQCPAADQHGYPQPNHVNVWIQTPIYLLLGAAEILGYVSMTEYAHEQAPPNSKAVVQALVLLTLAFGYALGTALGPVSKNPWLVILYSSLAGLMAFCAVLHWVLFRKRDEEYRKLLEENCEA